jgi:hypothetical protein
MKRAAWAATIAPFANRAGVGSCPRRDKLFASILLIISWLQQNSSRHISSQTILGRRPLHDYSGGNSGFGPPVWRPLPGFVARAIQ